MKTKPNAPTDGEKAAVKEEAIKWAKARLNDPNTLIVDVETTGLLTKDPKTEIVSVSIINHEGRVVLAGLVNPNRPIPLDAQKIHGIDDRMVKDAPDWTTMGQLVANAISGKHVVAFNAGFDIHLIVTLLQRYKLDIPDFDVSCAMEYYSRFIGDWSSTKKDYRWQALPKLAYGKAHDSLVDCQSTLLLLKKMTGDFSDEPEADAIQLDF